MSREDLGGPRPPDPYEAAYMQGQGEILYRDKRKVPRSFSLLFLLPALVTLSLGFVEEVPLLIPLFTSAFLLVMWMLFYEIRILVSRQEVQIQYGLFGPTIPIAAIERCEAVDYHWTEFGGWGIKRSFRDGTTAYNLPGDQGRAVKIEWREGGELRKVLVSAESPERLALAINRARSEQAQDEEAPIYEEARPVPPGAAIEIDEEALAVPVGVGGRGEEER